MLPIAEMKAVPSTARNVIVAVVGTIATALLMGGWKAKENVSDHTADIVAIRNEEAIHNVRDSAQYQTLINLICEGRHPRPEKCKQ